MERSCGVLVHPTSFPGNYGIGDLGEGAMEFIDFLKKAKQNLWQVLPLGPTSFGDSPYQSFSTFAGNHYLISPDILISEGYITLEDTQTELEFDPKRIDYGPVIEYKMGMLKKAYATFKGSATKKQKDAYSEFCKKNDYWLKDYALFVAIKDHFIEERRNTFETEEYKAYKEQNAEYLTKEQTDDYFYGAVWNSWPEELVKRDKNALKEWSERLADEIGFFSFCQYEFFREWGLVKEYAHENGINVIGDIPIFVAMDSADVWANPKLYYLDSRGYPTFVAGVPPDYFSATGQLWGNPLYDWDAHKETGYKWWIDRINAALSVVDILRIDHFRGFEAYWSIPYGSPNAIKGTWEKGPGNEFFNAVKEALGTLPIIAEDLGVITEKVTKIRKAADLPGMKVLQFAFPSGNDNDSLPHNITDSNTVIYTGTHDNDTSLGWYTTATEKEKDYYRRYMNVSGENVSWDLIRLAFSSVADYAVVPIQDVMSLGTDARMNIPGTPAGNWQFRYTSDMLKDEMAEGLAYLAKLFRRNWTEEDIAAEAESEDTDMDEESRGKLERLKAGWKKEQE